MDIQQLAPIIVPIVSETIGKIVAKIAKDLKKNSDEISNSITPYLESTYQKCNIIKTLLDPTESVELLKIYSSQHFKYKKSYCDHYDFIERFKNTESHVLLTGSAGTGKSVFMKYLWLSLFTDSSTIPIFVELRNFNNISSIVLDTYLYRTLITGSSSISEKDFKSGLVNGQYTVILDGFDEVNYEKRGDLQSSIIETSTNYPNVKFIVSSRKNDDFSSWPNFHVCEIQEFNKEHTIDLIKKSQIAEDVKKKFIKNIISTDIYIKYKTFLTNPLLTMMMVITFRHEKDLPNNIHHFYDLAYGALFYKHDKSKTGDYRRQMKSGLSVDEFKKVFSLFSFVTYSMNKIDFTRDEIIEFLNTAIKASAIHCKSEDILYDSINSVCLIVEDGLFYTFNHRSFQEYFTAYSISYLSNKSTTEKYREFSKKIHDQVILMCFRINSNKFCENYMLPESKKFDSLLKIDEVIEYIDRVNVVFSIYSKIKNQSGNRFITLNTENDFYYYCIQIFKIANSENTISADAAGLKIKNKNNNKNDTEFANYIFKDINEEQCIRIDIISINNVLKLRVIPTTSDGNIIEIDCSTELLDIFYNSNMYYYIKNVITIAKRYTRSELIKFNRSNKALGEIFSNF